MRWTAVQGFAPIEIVAELLCFLVIFFGFDDFGGDQSVALQLTAKLISDIGTLIDPFRNDVSSTFEGIIFIDDRLAQIFGSDKLDFIATLCHNNFGQRLQTIFTCGFRLGLFAFFEGKIKIFQTGKVGAVLKFGFQFGR